MAVRLHAGIMVNWNVDVQIHESGHWDHKPKAETAKTIMPNKSSDYGAVAGLYLSLVQ